MEGARAKFICVWFEFAAHAMLVDRTTLGAKPGEAAPGWRLAVASVGERPGAGAVWPPLQPVDHPLLIGPEPALSQLDVFDLETPDPAVRFRLDASLAVADAQSCWVLPCRDPEDFWRSGLFGDPVRVGCDALRADARELTAEEIVACAQSLSPELARASCWLVVPTAGVTVGPAVLAQGHPAAEGPVIDVLMQARPEGALQPAIELKAATNLRALLARFRFYVLRRNGPALKLPGVARSVGTQGAAAGAGRVIVALPEPIFHGDVVAVVAQGVAFEFSPRLAARGLRPSVEPDGSQIGLLVRREDDFAAVAGDVALEGSGLLDHFCGVIRAEAAPASVDDWLWRCKRQLAASFRRIGFAASHLLPPDLAERARVELARLLERERTARLDRLAYTASVAHRMQRLIAQSLAFDHAEPGAESEVGAVSAELSGFADFASNAAERVLLARVLEDPEAASAALTVATRSEALAAWLAALQR